MGHLTTHVGHRTRCARLGTHQVEHRQRNPRFAHGWPQRIVLAQPVCAIKPPRYLLGNPVLWDALKPVGAVELYDDFSPHGVVDAPGFYPADALVRITLIGPDAVILTPNCGPAGKDMRAWKISTARE
jgi:hypothetical protein